MRLSDFVCDKYSQFGEDGMIEHIFSTIGEGSRTCVEFGAADGVSCSNTKRLWENGWTALLIEGDEILYGLLATAAPKCRRVNAYVTPTGENSIDSILTSEGLDTVDFMSIDVDGIDYHIWEAMEARPRVICIEYNQSIPPRFSVRQKELSGSLGASAKALVELGTSKGYEFLGLTKANLLFVVTEESEAFHQYDTGLVSLFPYEALSFIATDFYGRPFFLGDPPWGLSQVPCIEETTGDPVNFVGPYLDLVKYFEAEVGSPALFLPQNWEVSPSSYTKVGRIAYRRVFSEDHPLIILDVANQSDIPQCRWVEDVGLEYNYKLRIVGRHLFVFTKEGI